ncbi:class I SAM-dependent methyltransferase [Parvicella tangerina]|uniref:Methyltransferase domain-containing protein n=1 Tax=Parvicella tangerina TaxID=2829795 RepID=A0A916NBH4_9FLAO|nr:class I SAM-dependent methyltransferase [Parvicella tangerina]CAG5083188.1 hypothetical protein CRYO30217_02116 [Parvicella tangerina]
MDQPNSTNKKAWPTRAAMQQIYELNLWGGQGSFYSGLGSHDPSLVDPYVKRVQSFLRSFEEPLEVVDLGCGDFNVGNQLVPFAKHYDAIDIVPALIERNKQIYQATNLTFGCMDIANDELPPGDVAILRQVLQHLSNAEVKNVVTKLYQYRFVILTEHLPDGTFEPNKDIISGQGIRLKKGSGLNLQLDPFNLKAKHSETWFSVPYSNGKGVITTTLFVL